MGNKQTPGVRFPGYTGDWEQRILGGILAEKISNGIMNQPGKNELNIRHINVVNLYSSGYIHLDELEYINATENDLKRCNVEVGDIFLTRSSLRVEGIAQANILLNGGTLVFDDHIMRVKLANGFDPFFVKESLNHSPIKREFMAKAKTGTMTTIGQDDIASSTISFPTKAEQTAIGNFFSTIDNLIALHQQELTTLKQTKQGFLQKMFPKEGKYVPEVRFPGFSGDWGQRKLGDISEKVTEKNKENIYSETLTNSAEFGIISQREFFDKDISNEKNLDGYYIVRPDDFVYNPRISNFAPVGPIKRNKLRRTGVISPLYYVFRTHDIEKTYLETYFSSTNWHLFMKMNGDSGARSDRFAIKDTIFREMSIPFPSIEEQTKISNFLKQLDETIALHKQELEALQQTKKAFLQKMFV